jgi:hypothetical protein
MLYFNEAQQKALKIMGMQITRHGVQYYASNASIVTSALQTILGIMGLCEYEYHTSYIITSKHLTKGASWHKKYLTPIYRKEEADGIKYRYLVAILVVVGEEINLVKLPDDVIEIIRNQAFKDAELCVD